MVLDLAVMLAAGGDCPADTAMLRGREEVFGPVASDPTISRLVHRLAADPDGLGALRRAAAAARGSAGSHLPPRAEVLVDIDGTLITAHSEKQDAAPTYSAGSASTRCWPTPTTGRAGPGSRSPGCCGPATPTPAPPPTTRPCWT